METNETLQPRLLGVADAALYLGATRWFVADAIRHGRLAFVRCGKRYLVDRGDLDGFIELSKEKREPKLAKVKI